jgi:hypothetical protein
MSIEKYMDASTCFITENDNALLEECSMFTCPITVYGYDYGCFVIIDPELEEGFDEEMREFGFSAEFIELVKFAQRQDCGFLRLDCDGDDSYDFPKFVW